MPRTRSGVRGRVVKGLVRIGSLLWVIALQAAETDPLARYETTHTLPDLHHAVGMSLPDDWPAPEDLPLGSRRVVECKTCHGLKDLERIPYRQVDKQAVNFLRGGPYARLDDFCIRCHDRKALERPNIHILLDEQGKIREDRCTYCHEEVQQNRDERTGRWIIACACHRKNCATAVTASCRISTPWNIRRPNRTRPCAVISAHRNKSRVSSCR